MIPFWISRYSRTVLTAVTLLVLGVSVYILAYQPGLPISNYDSSYYQHTGLFLAQGHIPYLHAWTAKPPLVPLSQWGLAILSGGNRYLLHAVNIFLTGLAALGTVVLTGELASELSGGRLAGLAAGLGLLCLPAVYIKPAMGFRPKLFVACFGVDSLWLQRHRYPTWSGASGCLALGFWQFGIVFPIMSTMIVLESGPASRWRRTVIGFLGTGLVVMLPIIWWGSLEAMIVETIAVPLLLPESTDWLTRMKMLSIWTNFALPFLVLGVLGLGASIRDRAFREPWIWLGAAIVGIQVFAIDLDGPADAIVLFVFVGFGLSYVVKQFTPAWATTFIAVLVGLILVNGASQLALIEAEGLRTFFPGRWSFFNRSVVKEQPRRGAISGNGSEEIVIESWAPHHYWSKTQPAGCYYRQSVPIHRWMIATGGSLNDRTCGDFDSIVRYFQPRSFQPRSNEDTRLESFDTF